VIFLNAVVVSKFGEPSCLEYKEIEIPQIQENQVLIKVKATSVNFADVKKRKGTYPGQVQLPFIPGLEASGIVVDFGKNVSGFSVGQKVIALPDTGSYAEYIAVNEDLVFPIPETMCLEKAAAFPIVSFASYSLLNDIVRVQKGESVLIHAASGGFGTTAIQFARLLGATNIIATVSRKHKKSIAEEVGAKHIINYTNENFSERVLEITEGKGVDVILDSLGGKIFSESLKCLAPFGRIAYYGNATEQKAYLDIDELYPSNRNVMGFSFGMYRKLKPEKVREIAIKVISYMEEDVISMKVTKKFHLKEAAAAHEWIESRQSVGKVLLIP
jgi:NADPH2:quinone reductase